MGGTQLGLALKLGFVREIRGEGNSLQRPLCKKRTISRPGGGFGLEQGTLSLPQTLVLLYQVTEMSTVAIQFTLQECLPSSVT